VEKANAGVFVSISAEPPPLPVYAQPPIPGPGYIWTPGYWAWDEDVSDYYWVPGAWVPAPEPGLLWTPGYWAWNDGAYFWNDGYWGPEVGFYGGVCYGYGYTGAGFHGGYWGPGGNFHYNRSVTNVGNTTVIPNVYNKSVINHSISKVSFNGGPNGAKVAPTPQELLAANKQHFPPTKDQSDHRKLAGENKDLHASVNKGRPPIAAVSKAGDFKHPFAARGAPALVKPASLPGGHPLDAHRLDRDRFVKPKGPVPARPLNALHQPPNGIHGKNAIVRGANNPMRGPQFNPIQGPHTNTIHGAPPHAMAAFGGAPAHGLRNVGPGPRNVGSNFVRPRSPQFRVAPPNIAAHVARPAPPPREIKKPNH
jgi:hypothetical protein